MENAILPAPLKKVPTFIKVLTVFSFVGVNTGALFYLWLMEIAYRHNENTEFMNKIYENIQQPENMVQGYSNLYIWSQATNLVAFVSQFISLIGIIYIRKLKKAGFVLYISSECISLGLLIACAVKLGIEFPSGLFGQSPATSAYVLIATIIFDFAFIIMYNANYKHLK